MALKFLLKKFKAFKVRRVSTKAIKNKSETQRIWTGVSHGSHIVEEDDNSDINSFVVAQKEQVEGCEFWLYGAYDQQMGSGITKYFQSRLIDNNLTESQIRRKGKAIMKKAYVSTMGKIQEAKKENEMRGSTSMLVVNGERIIAAYCGGYRAVVSRDGVAQQLGMKNRRKRMGRWSVSDVWNMQCTASNGEPMSHKSSKLIVTARKVKPEIEFIILASDGIWEVMRNQEAVDLVAHIQDAQKAAECLAEEALNRMSKSTISCIVIRFH